MEKLKRQLRGFFKGTTIESKDKTALIEDMVTYYIKERCTQYEAYLAIMAGYDVHH